MVAQLLKKPVFKHLGEVADVFIGVPTKESDRAIIDKTATKRILTVRCLGDDVIHSEQMVYARVPRWTEGGKCQVKEGDVLIPSRSTSFKAAVVPRELEGITFNATLIAIRCKAILPKVFMAYLKHPKGQEALAAVCQSGTAQMNITIAALEKLKVPFADRKVQFALDKILFSAE